MELETGVKDEELNRIRELYKKHKRSDFEDWMMANGLC